MLAGWAILAPLSKHKGWAPGKAGSMEDGARGWILWVALAVMCGDAAISLLPVTVEFIGKARDAAFGSSHPSEDDKETEPEDRLVLTSWVLSGLAVSVILGTVLVWWIFGGDGIKPWATVIAYVIASVLGLLG